MREILYFIAKLCPEYAPTASYLTTIGGEGA